MQLGDLRTQVHVDLRVAPDALDEVGGHAPAELLPAHDHRHARARVAEVHHGLAGGVARADHDHVVAAALRGLAAPGAVVAPAPEQLVHAGELEPPPAHARRGEQHVGRDLVPACDRDDGLAAVGDPAAHDAAQEHQLRAEFLRLAAGQPGELGPADTLREAEEVLDQRGVRGLAARKVLLGHERREPVGGRVDRCRQPGRPGAHDQQVVVLQRRPGRRPPRRGERGHRRTGVHGVLLEHDRQRRIDDPARREQHLRLRRPRFHILVRLRAAHQEVAQLVIARLQPAADDLNRGSDGAHWRETRNMTSST